MPLYTASFTIQFYLQYKNRPTSTILLPNKAMHSTPVTCSSHECHVLGQQGTQLLHCLTAQTTLLQPHFAQLQPLDISKLGSDAYLRFVSQGSCKYRHYVIGPVVGVQSQLFEVLLLFDKLGNECRGLFSERVVGEIDRGQVHRHVTQARHVLGTCALFVLA